MYVCIYKFNKYFLNQQQTVVYKKKKKLINVTSSTRPLVHKMYFIYSKVLLKIN